MQNSQLYRRGIVMPLDQDAESRLRANTVEESTLVRSLPIKDQAQFDELWSLGLFRRINDPTHGMIDDYEEDFVEVPALKGLQAAVKDTHSENNSPSVTAFLTALSSLASEAESSGRPLLFVL